MFTYGLSLKLKGLNTLQNLTNSKFTQIFSKNKLQSKLKTVFRISYFDNSGKRVYEHVLLSLFYFPTETGYPVSMRKSARGDS